jgi:hypothetical protein
MSETAGLGLIKIKDQSKERDVQFQNRWDRRDFRFSFT